MKHKINRISEDAMLSKMLELGMIKPTEFGYVQAYDEDGRLWSKKRASMTLSIEFGYRANAHHVSTGFMKKFNKLSEEHMIRWEWLKNDSRVLPPKQNKRRECETDLGFDSERCSVLMRLNIQKRWLRIEKIEDEDRKRQFIDRYRDFLKKHHPEIFPDLNPVDPSRQTESLESILATSASFFGSFSNHHRYDYDQYCKSDDQTLDEYRY